MADPHSSRVLVTRASNGSSELADRLRAEGCEPVLIPAIELAPPSSFAVLDAALASMGSFHWLLFTSANAVEIFASRWDGTPVPYVAGIGPATARALEKIGLKVDLVPPQAIAESLATALLPHVRQADGQPARLLLVRAEQAREHLPETLRAAGAEVTVAPAYRTVIPPGSVALIRDLFAPGTVPLSAITFTSASTARNLLALCEAASVRLPASALRISIGPITTETLTELGLPPHHQSPEATVAALARTTAAALGEGPAFSLPV